MSWFTGGSSTRLFVRFIQNEKKPIMRTASLMEINRFRFFFDWHAFSNCLVSGTVSYLLAAFVLEPCIRWQFRKVLANIATEQ